MIKNFILLFICSFIGFFTLSQIKKNPSYALKIGNQYGIFNLKGEKMSPEIFDGVYDFEEYTDTSVLGDVFTCDKALLVKQKNLFGLFKDDSLLIPCEYQFLKKTDGTYQMDDIVIAVKNNKYGLINLKNKVLHNFLYDSLIQVNSFQNNRLLFRAWKNKKVKLIEVRKIINSSTYIAEDFTDYEADDMLQEFQFLLLKKDGFQQLCLLTSTDEEYVYNYEYETKKTQNLSKNKKYACTKPVKADFYVGENNFLIVPYGTKKAKSCSFDLFIDNSETFDLDEDFEENYYLFEDDPNFKMQDIPLNFLKAFADYVHDSLSLNDPNYSPPVKKRLSDQELQLKIKGHINMTFKEYNSDQRNTYNTISYKIIDSLIEGNLHKVIQFKEPDSLKEYRYNNRITVLKNNVEYSNLKKYQNFFITKKNNQFGCQDIYGRTFLKEQFNTIEILKKSNTYIVAYSKKSSFVFHYITRTGDLDTLFEGTLKSNYKLNGNSLFICLDSTKNSQFNRFVRCIHNTKEKLKFTGYECKKVEPIFDSIVPTFWFPNLFYTYKCNSTGMIDINGDIVFPFIYDSIQIPYFFKSKEDKNRFEEYEAYGTNVSLDVYVRFVCFKNDSIQFFNKTQTDWNKLEMEKIGDFKMNPKSFSISEDGIFVIQKISDTSYSIYTDSGRLLRSSIHQKPEPMTYQIPRNQFWWISVSDENNIPYLIGKNNALFKL